jgi:SPP1 gp7 family putative phage head morphogenesis protein
MILDASSVKIRDMLRAAKAIETKEKYYRIAAEIKRVTKDCHEQLAGQLELDFLKLAEEETRFAEKALRGARVKADFELPAPRKIWAAASFGNYAGYGSKETYQSYLDGLGNNLFKTWDIQTRVGYMAGLTAKQINRNVLGTVGGLDVGSMRVLRRSLEMNTRTMVAHLAETARDALYKENAGLFSGYKYLGTLDSRSCLVCGNLDGKVFKEIEDAPKLPKHPNCRCLLVPLVKGMEEDDEDDTRASEDGPVPAKMTFTDWLKTQPDEFARDILGPVRFSMYKDGTDLSGFVAGNRILTLKQLEAADGLPEPPLRDGNVFKADTFDEINKHVKEEWGVEKTDFAGLDIEAVKGTFEAMETALSKWPELKGKIIEIGQSKAGIMSTIMKKEGFQLNFNPWYYGDISRIKEVYEKGLEATPRHYPTNTNWTNAGVHELGHIAHGVIAKNNSESAWQAINDWRDNTTTGRIVKEAWKNVKKEYPKGTKIEYARVGISRYADNRDNKDAETIAEAFSDAFTNRSNAQPLSREIVRIIKEELK